MVVNNVADNHPELYGSKAEDVFFKLRTDAHSRKIFNFILDKMNQNEIDLLYKKNISFFLDKDSDNYSERQFVLFCKGKLDELVSVHIIKSYVLEIEKEIINGSRDMSIKLFELFGDQLSYFSEESKETILTYLYSCLGLCSRYSKNPNLYNFSSKGIIDKLNLYLNQSQTYYDLHLGVMKSIVENIADLEEDADKWDARLGFKSLKEGLSIDEYENFINQESLKPNIQDFIKILNDKKLSPL